MEPSASLASALAAEHDVQLAVLFGSTARGTGNAHSDLDVGVLGIHSPARLAALAVALSRASGREVDLIALKTAPPLVRFEIARDGTVLLERTPNVWSTFRARAMVDWWDWAPVARRFAAAAHARLRQRDYHGSA